VLAVAIPYLLKLQELSRQETCRNRIKQLGVAVLRHHDVKQRFPAGQLTRRFKSAAVGRHADPAEPRSADGKPASGASWVVSALPFFDHKELYDQWSGAKSVAENRAVAEVDLPELLCPSRRDAGLIAGTDRIAADWQRGGGDFAACSGSGITFNDEARQSWALDDAQLAATSRGEISPYSQSPLKRGIFGVNSATTRNAVDAADGLSHVLLLAERRVFVGSGSGANWSSDGWAWGGPATLFSTRYAPHTGLHYDEADSLHPGLVNVVMADAGVRPVSWNIDLRTWTNLGNYAQGVPLEHPELGR